MDCIKRENCDNDNAEVYNIPYLVHQTHTYQQPVIERNLYYVTNVNPTQPTVIQGPLKREHYDNPQNYHNFLVGESRQNIKDDINIEENNLFTNNQTIDQNIPEVKSEERDVLYYYLHCMENFEPSNSALNLVNTQALPNVIQESENISNNYNTNPDNLVINDSLTCQNIKIDMSVVDKDKTKPYEVYVKVMTDGTLSTSTKFDCYNCQKLFSSENTLKRHQKSCISKTKKTKICDICQYTCKSSAILKVHKRRHSGIKPFSCTLCQYSSSQKTNVNKHILTHSNVKPLKCSFCDYKCIQKNNLVIHERTHTGLKPYICNICDYKTAQKANLNKHFLLHTNEKPFKCDQCSYRCVQKANLMKHFKKHTSDYNFKRMNFVCLNCGKKYMQESLLAKHSTYCHKGL